MIKYITKSYDNSIKKAEVLRESEHTVTVLVRGGVGGKSRRENKRSDFTNWHDSWEDAHRFLISGAEREIECLRSRLEQANRKLEKIQQIKNPEACK